MSDSESGTRPPQSTRAQPAAQRSGPARGPLHTGLRLLKGVSLALLPLIGLLLLCELVLWAADLGDPQERLTLSRGFSEEARYLVPDPDVPGGWVTQMYDDDVPEVRIGPRGERLRVLLFGGSNTQSFPQAYLQEQLDAAAARKADGSAQGPGYEVVNLGRAGYGSERVRILLTQAMVLQPDIVLLYSGHNEFVERGFAMELIDAWRQPWLTRIVDRLTRLRTLNVLVSLLERPPAAPTAAGAPAADAAPGTAASASAAPLPESRQPRGPDFRDLSYDKTLLFYDVYRANLEAMIDTAQRAGAQVMLCTVIGNMLVPPMVAGTPGGLSPERLARFRGLQHEALELLPRSVRTGLLQAGPDDPPIRLSPIDWGDSIRPEVRAARLALGRHPQPPRLRTLEAPFAKGPYWLDPALWKPSVMELLPTIAAVFGQVSAPKERLRIESAAERFEEARALCADDAGVLFGLGVCRLLLGEHEQAVQLLRESARFDRAPTRGNDVTNGIVRALAAARPELAFLDAEELARAACPAGLISYELMMDNCHLHPAARPALMDACVPGLLELGARCRRGAQASR